MLVVFFLCDKIERDGASPNARGDRLKTFLRVRDHAVRPDERGVAEHLLDPAPREIDPQPCVLQFPNARPRQLAQVSGEEDAPDGVGLRLRDLLRHIRHVLEFVRTVNPPVAQPLEDSKPTSAQ